MSFQNFNLPPLIMKALEAESFQCPTEIQHQAIPLLMSGHNDFVGQAPTGTGKTLAFILPLLSRLDLQSKKIQALIITPTRELTLQIHDELSKFSRYLKIKSTTVYGGVPYHRQVKALTKVPTQVVVGTPGRIIDLIKQGVLKLGECSQLVIDEADEMLNMGFLEDVQTIIRTMPTQRRIWMFSATIPKAIEELVEASFSNPTIMRTKRKTLSSNVISQYYCLLSKKDFVSGLKVIYQDHKDCAAIVFCETKLETKKVAELLEKHGTKTLALHGDLSQAQRETTMRMFKEKKVNILVCTDVAARGIDVSHITHVFNMGLPRQSEAYLHRIGRTGRAGKCGVAISFITKPEMIKLRRLEGMMGTTIPPYPLPGPKQLKIKTIQHELEKFEATKQALIHKGTDFIVDESYAFFEQTLKELTKDQLLKLFFSYYFKKEMQQIDENITRTRLSAVSHPASKQFEKRKRRGNFAKSRNNLRRQRIAAPPRELLLHLDSALLN